MEPPVFLKCAPCPAEIEIVELLLINPYKLVSQCWIKPDASFNNHVNCCWGKKKQLNKVEIFKIEVVLAFCFYLMYVFDADFDFDPLIKMYDFWSTSVQ